MSALRGAMRRPSRVNSVALVRGFRLLDVMILVAAVAMGCRMTLSVFHASKSTAFDAFHELFLEWPTETWWGTAEKSLLIASLAMPLVAMMSLALIPIRLRGPRPRWRRLTRQPGLLAGCAAALAIGFVGLPTVVAAVAAGTTWEGLVGQVVTEWQLWDLTILGSLAILVSWGTMLVGRRWRAEPSGVDRLGRTMGGFWIVVGFAALAGIFYSEAVSCGFKARRINPSTAEVIGQNILHLASRSVPLIAAVTLVLIPIRLLGSGPRGSRWAHQPGLLAAWAVGLVMAFVGFHVAFLAVEFGVSWMEVWEWVLDEEVVALVTKSGGLAVASSWMTLLVGRCWRAESSGVDRLGRALGVCWIVAGLAVVAGAVLIETESLRVGDLRRADSTSIQTAMLERIRRPNLLR